MVDLLTDLCASFLHVHFVTFDFPHSLIFSVPKSQVWCVEEKERHAQALVRNSEFREESVDPGVALCSSTQLVTTAGPSSVC